MKATTLRKLKKLKPCNNAYKWVQSQPSTQAAWANCERGDWMLWLLANCCGRQGSPSHRKLVAVTCQAIIPLVRIHASDKRAMAAIRIAMRWARRDEHVSLVDVRSAAAVASSVSYAAAYAADAAGYSAAYAAHAADAAASAAYAVGARRRALKRIANYVRRRYLNPPRLIEECNDDG